MISVRVVKSSKKEWTCTSCGQAIKPGERHTAITGGHRICSVCNPDVVGGVVKGARRRRSHE